MSIELGHLRHQLTRPFDVNSYYTIQPDGWVIGGESISTNFRVRLKQIHS